MSTRSDSRRTERTEVEPGLDRALIQLDDEVRGKALVLRICTEGAE